MRTLSLVEQAAVLQQQTNRQAQPRTAAAWRSLVRPLGRTAMIGGLVAAVAALILVAAGTVPALIGYHVYVVNGGSMGQSMPLGSIAVAKPTSPITLNVGDIIAYRASPQNQPVLHRIISIIERDGRRLFTTQGDVNRSPDPQPVALDGPGDKVVYSVPYAGYILNFAKSPLGKGLLIGLPLVAIAVSALRESWRAVFGRRPQPGSNRSPRPLRQAAPQPASQSVQRSAPRSMPQPARSAPGLALRTLLGRAQRASATEFPGFMTEQLRQHPRQALAPLLLFPSPEAHEPQRRAA